MKNEIIRITNEEKNDLLESLDKTSCFVVEIDGSEISTVNDLFDVMEQEYDLHTSDGTWGRNWAAFKDLMTDLEWIDSKKHILIIDDFKKMLTNHNEEKERLLRYFEHSILPFWEKDVLRVVVEGETKEFTVYLVD